MPRDPRAEAARQLRAINRRLGRYVNAPPVEERLLPLDFHDARVVDWSFIDDNGEYPDQEQE